MRYYDISYGVNCELKSKELTYMKKDIKKRNWTFELYDDSCANDWESYLISTGIPFAYAYHDKDITEIGEHKKNHYHVLLCYDGPTTYNTAKELADRVGAANGVIQPVGSIRGMIRYFCHLDNADKYQYPESIIQCRNGFDPKDYFSLTVSQQKEFKRKVTNFIRDNDIQYYSELIDILSDSDETDMLDTASTNTFYFTQYIGSRKNYKRDAKLRVVNEKKL